MNSGTDAQNFWKAGVGKPGVVTASGPADEVSHALSLASRKSNVKVAAEQLHMIVAHARQSLLSGD